MENPRVKCKDCGAFGHKASSLRCPMKRCAGAITLQPLGSSKMKENLKPWTPRDLRNPGPFSKAARETQQRAGNGEQRQALLQRFPQKPPQRPQGNWKDETQSCGYVRHPHGPMPVHTPQRRCVRDLELSSGSAGRNHDVPSSALPIQGAEGSTCSQPGLDPGQGRPVTDPHFVQDPNQCVHRRNNRPHSASRNHELGHALTPQALTKFPEGNSGSIRHPAVQSVGQDANLTLKAPGKRAAQTSIQTVQNIPKKPRLSPCLSPQKSMEKTELQLPQESLLPEAVQACHMPQLPPNTLDPGQSIGMVFKRLGGCQWSSKVVTAPSLPPADKPSFHARTSPSSEKSEGLCVRVPQSVLYEDLLVSSSSEESDSQ